MKNKKVRYIGHVIKESGFWNEGDTVKFTPTQYKRGFKAKRVGSEWMVLNSKNVKFFAKKTTLVTKETKEEQF